MLLDALAHCVRERFSDESLDTLCDALESGSKSNDDPTFELFEAMTNYVYQLRDGAIEVTADTTSLFRKAESLLDEDSAFRQGISFDDEVTNLLERIDLEASGGFDALEAGEVPEFDKSTDSESDSIRTHNSLHRLLASLESIESIAEETRSSVPFARVFARHRRLLDALTPPANTSHALPLRTLEELLTLQLTVTSTDVDVDDESVVHPTYIPLLSSLVTQLVNTLSIIEISDLSISRKQDTIEIQLVLHTSETHLSGSRALAVEKGFLHPDAPLREAQELQYLLLPESAEAHEPLIRSAALIDQLQTVCAQVTFEATEETHRLTTVLPANVSLEEVAVFKLNGALYALLTESVTEVIYPSKTARTEVSSTLETELGSYRVSTLNTTSGNHEACLLIDDGENRLALFVDRIETPGQLPIFDSFSVNNYVGGGMRLLDRRLVVLLSIDDLDDALTSTLSPRKSATYRLLVLGEVPLASQLSKRIYQTSIAAGELNATAAFQEQHPHAILVEQNDLPVYGNLLTHANRLNIPVIVQRSGSFDIEIQGSRDEFKSIINLTELEALLQTLVLEDGERKL